MLRIRKRKNRIKNIRYLLPEKQNLNINIEKEENSEVEKNNFLKNMFKYNILPNSILILIYKLSTRLIELEENKEFEETIEKMSEIEKFHKKKDVDVIINNSTSSSGNSGGGSGLIASIVGVVLLGVLMLYCYNNHSVEIKDCVSQVLTFSKNISDGGGMRQGNLMDEMNKVTLSNKQQIDIIFENTKSIIKMLGNTSGINKRDNNKSVRPLSKDDDGWME